MTLAPILNNNEGANAHTGPRKSRPMCIFTSKKIPAFFCDDHVLQVTLDRSPLKKGGAALNGGHFLTRKVTLHDQETKYPLYIELPEVAQYDVTTGIIGELDATESNSSGMPQNQYHVHSVKINSINPKNGIIDAEWEITNTKDPKRSTLFPQCYNVNLYTYIQDLLRATQDPGYAKQKKITIIKEPYLQKQIYSLANYGCKLQHPHSLGCCDPECTCEAKAPITVQLYYLYNHKRVPTITLASVYPKNPGQKTDDDNDDDESTSEAPCGSASSAKSSSARSAQAGSTSSSQSGSSSSALSTQSDSSKDSRNDCP